MDQDQERDYAEERYNERLMREEYEHAPEEDFSAYPAGADPLWNRCEDCNAEPGEECRPDCLGIAAREDALSAWPEGGDEPTNTTERSTCNGTLSGRNLHPRRPTSWPAVASASMGTASAAGHASNTWPATSRTASATTALPRTTH